MSKAIDDAVHDGSVSLWHPWNDKPGMLYTPSMWDYREKSYSLSFLGQEPSLAGETVAQLISDASSHKLYIYTPDILHPRLFPYGNTLLGHKHAVPYVSRSGNIAAIRLAGKRRSGFLIPTSTWLWDDPPSREFLEYQCIFSSIVGFQATTPASASEKVLRSTLPTPLVVSRPSAMLRRDILDNNDGGLVVRAKVGKFYKKVKEYDENKAYLFHSLLVPSPFFAPVIRTNPSLDAIMGYATGWWHCRLVARYHPVSPLQINGDAPKDGAIIDKWLWTGELQDALEAGYTFLDCRGGYGWHEMSNFMEEWAYTLWDIYEKMARYGEWFKLITKRMMVGLPGRFLKQPETYRLVHYKEAQKGDIPLKMHIFEQGQPVFSDYVVRPEYDNESTALSPVGSFIVAEMRRDLYHRMLDEYLHGNEVLRGYVDCYAIIDHGGKVERDIGTLPGQWKEKEFTNVWSEENRFIGKRPDRKLDVRAPGHTRKQKAQLVRKYRKEVRNHEAE